MTTFLSELSATETARGRWRRRRPRPASRRPTLALCLLLLLGAVAASAAPHLQEVDATLMTRIDIDIRRGVVYRFRTADLPAGADTELRLVRAADNAEVAHNDNDPAAGGLSSSITYYSTIRYGLHHLYVLAHEGTPPGNARVLVDEDRVTVVDRVVPFGGVTVAVPPSTTSEKYNYLAVTPPGGSEDPLLMALGVTGSMLALDDDTGVGSEAWILGVSGVRKLLVGTLTQPGRVRLLANDVWSDHDGDNLGAALEAALESCDQPADPGCAQVHNTLDSDRDSIPDYVEAVGLAFNPPLFFPRWGADPAHKDVFIEVDYRDQYALPPLTEAQAVELQAFYADGPANQLLNLDGQPGIRIHLDAGVQPSDPANAALIGDWGGADQIPAGAALNGYFTPQRELFFFHAIIDSGGQSWGRTFGVGLNGDTPRAQIETFAHELGHSLRLSHGGDPSWGMNCSPIYRSTMNYAAAAWGDEATFSIDTDYPGLTLNPASLCEREGLGGADVSHLARYGIRTQGLAVDWNGDGVIQDCAAAVRAAVNFYPPAGCDTHTRGEEHLDHGGSPSLARMNDWLYAFYIDGNGDMVYRRGLVYADAHEAGCPNGWAVEPGETCTDWKPPVSLPQDGRVASFNSFSVDGMVHLLFRFAGLDEIFYFSATQQAPDGFLSGWSTVLPLPGASSTWAPELSLLYVDAARYGSERLVAAIWSDASSGELLWSYDDPQQGVAFSAPQPLRGADGRPLASNGTRPTLVHWGLDSGVRTGDEATLMVFPEARDSRIGLYAYDPQRDAWLSLTATALPVRPTGLIEQPIGFGWRPLADAQGQVGDPLLGEFTLTYGATSEAPGSSTWISSVVSTRRPPVAALSFPFARAGRFGHAWYAVKTPGGGMDYYTDPGFPYLKGLLIDGADRVVFLPHPDGIFDRQFRSGSDWWIMERGICLTLRNNDVGWCGGPNVFGY